MQKCIVKKRLLYRYSNATKLVQRLLGVKQDGICGKNTETVIKAFQKKNGLVVDGCVGLNTWLVLLGIK
jgi:peptidoglycan hydrolase-like protein with peptidoglycan-binding domain